MMRVLMVCAAAGLVALASLACEGLGIPAAPSPSAIEAPASLPGTAQATPIGLKGVVRGLDLQSGSFSVVARSVTHLVRVDRDTQVWNRGTHVRLAALGDGATVSIRGYDYGRYVLARTISIN